MQLFQVVADETISFHLDAKSMENGFSSHDLILPEEGSVSVIELRPGKEAAVIKRVDSREPSCHTFEDIVTHTIPEAGPYPDHVYARLLWNVGIVCVYMSEDDMRNDIRRELAEGVINSCEDESFVKVAVDDVTDDWEDIEQKVVLPPPPPALCSKTPASGKRFVADPLLFGSEDPALWEKVYRETIEKKYIKDSRNFSRKIHGCPTKAPQIFLIPRTRGGPSYKQHALQGAASTDLQYAPISKGYSMQNVSSFTIGPVVGEGLCLVNAAYSKIVCVTHIEGGGSVDLRRTCFWKPAKKPHRKIEIHDDARMYVDGVLVETHTWLAENESLWLNGWEKWRRSVALASRGDFHWSGGSFVVAYRHRQKYIGFRKWKIECYVRPSFKLLPETDVFKFLYETLYTKKVSLGLVHPMAGGNNALRPLTKEFLKSLIDSDTAFACQPYVVAAKLLGVEL